MDQRMAERALTPRYTTSEAAALVGRRAETVRRWSFGHERTYKGKPRRDEPLIHADGERGALALSFLNLLELRMLSLYRGMLLCRRSAARLSMSAASWARRVRS
jgi:transposase-like protein